MQSGRLLLISAIIITMFLSGCSTLMQQLTDQGMRRGVSSSLVEYLYPRGETPPEFKETRPKLNLPIRVGVTFVPSNADNSIALTAVHKSELLKKVKSSFEDKAYINEIVVIPETYMRSSQGFESIDQVARLYALDTIALISYDQVIYTDDMRSSILYWTIVGAFFINGSKNDINTFVDVAIFDIQSHKLLLRAPGVDKVIAKSTLINSAEKLRKARQSSFTNAIDNLSMNLETELISFKERIKQDKSVDISYRAGFTGGGGSMSWLILLLIIGLLCKTLATTQIWKLYMHQCKQFWKYSPDPRF